jgi:hypothetical protein
MRRWQLLLVPVQHPQKGLASQTWMVVCLRAMLCYNTMRLADKSCSMYYILDILSKRQPRVMKQDAKLDLARLTPTCNKQTALGSAETPS